MERDIAESEAEKIGRRVAYFRDELRLTNEQLAGLIGMSKPGVDKLIGGQSCKQFAKLKVLAKALQTTPQAILEWPAEDADCSEPLQAVLEGVYVALGLPLEEARSLAETVRVGLKSPGPASAAMDRLDYLRARAEISTRLAFDGRNQQRPAVSRPQS